MEYTMRELRNQYGSQFGVEYNLVIPKGTSYFDAISLQQRLIQDVIGEDNYYSQRDVWDQIRIKWVGPGVENAMREFSQLP